MKESTANHLKEAADTMGGDEFEIRSDYSGRGMYGSTTHAIVVEGNILPLVAMAAALLGEGDVDGNSLNDFIEDLNSLRSDNMGRSATVWY